MKKKKLAKMTLTSIHFSSFEMRLNLYRMEYFGNRIEPFHMKDDRETGTIHEDGFVEISKTKERQTRYDYDFLKNLNQK